ncbi:MAG: restriction endonuclease subunit S [Caldilineaceae bacterium]|nr:restriction endonuclease subunit S [Caldilineaceae bacterium]
MASEYVEDGIPFFRSKNVAPYRILWDDMKYISRQFHEKIAKSSLHPGDVVIVRTGKPGTASIIPDTIEEANCSDLVIVRPGPKLDKRFLAYYLNSAAIHHINAHLVGAVQQHFNVGAAKKLSIPLPPFPEQKAIAHILGCLDDKIELNRRMNATLEGMAQALFQSWFVDFDPVIDNALAAGNPLPDELAERADLRSQALADGTANREAAQAFPAAFQRSEALGWIPAGWEVSTIGDEVTAVGGGTPSTKNGLFWDGIHPFCTPKDMSKLDSLVLLDTERYLTDLGAQKVSSGILPKGTLLMSSRAPIGYLAIAETPVTVNQGIIALLKNETYQPMFLLSWLRSNMEKIVERANGSTFLEISKRNFKPIPFLKPNENAPSLFNAQVEAIHRKIVSCVENTNQIATLRDTLLPKLISGDLRIPDAAALAEEALA